MSEKPIPKTKASSKAPQSGVDFEIDVSLSGLEEDGRAFDIDPKRAEIISRSRKGEDIEPRLKQLPEWEADGLGETETYIPDLPPHPPVPLEDKKDEDYEIRVIRYLNSKIQKTEVLVQKLKNDPSAPPEVIERAERTLESHRKDYQRCMEQLQSTASETATDASLDDAFADILGELNEAGFEATGNADDFPTEEQAKAAERQDELNRIRELVSQLDMNSTEGEWITHQSEHLKGQPDRKQLIDYLTRKQEEAVIEFLKRKELERKTEQETAIQEEIKKREEEQRIKKEIGDFIMDTIVEGKGARIENLEAFERQGGKVHESDSWGFRKIEWRGRFNVLDGDNRLIKPMVGQEWFDAVGEFHLWSYKHSPTSREKKLMAPIKKGGETYFLTVDGELLPLLSPTEELRAFYENKEEAEVIEGEPIFMESAERHIVYVEILAEELAAFAQRFDEADKQALFSLKDKILAVKNSDMDLDWKAVLLSVKECVKNAKLSANVAFIKDRLFLRLAKTARAYDAELDFNGLAELDDYQWEPYGRYDQGVIIQFNKDNNRKYTLIRDGKLLYSMGEALDTLEPFAGKVARVSAQRDKMVLYNFILKENGELFNQEWFKFIYPSNHGMSRLRTLDDRYNYMNPETGLLISDIGYDEAGDFDKSGKALVKQAGEKFYINREGKRLQPIQVVASIVVDRHFDTAKTGPIPTIEELKARIKERTQDAKDRHISHQFRDRFQELIEAHPEVREELYRLFSSFRQTVNMHIGKNDNDKKIHEDHIIKTLIGKVEKSALNRKLKQTLRDTIYNLRYKKPIWGRVDLLPVPLVTGFSTLIQVHSEEKDALFSLIMRLEMKIQQFPKKERHSRVLRENLRNLIFGKESKLSLKTKRTVYDMLLTMMNNPDIQWGGSSADRQTFKREHTERRINRLCAFAEGGRIDEAYQGFQKLLQSGHGQTVLSKKRSTLKTLALSFYQHLYQLSQSYQAGDRNPALVKKYKDIEKKTIDVLRCAHTADPDDTQIQQLIDLLKTPEKPISLAGMEKKVAPSARSTIKPRRSRLKILIVLGMAAAAAMVTHRHICSDNSKDKKPAVTQPYKGNIKAGLGLAKVQTEQGNMRAAGILFRRLLKAEPKNADIHAAYGQFLIKLNKLEGAEWHLNRALELDPANELAQRELKKIETNGTK
ncbi:tetratricopeptide repeat protein [Patescibacteria group bacterium]|nr:tetratricopeptide repeat protein [Patescibacteria group bacterium]